MEGKKKKKENKEYVEEYNIRDEEEEYLGNERFLELNTLLYLVGKGIRDLEAILNLLYESLGLR